MTTFYADSSALVKVHLPEHGTAWMRSLVRASNGHTLATSRLSAVEVVSALNRRVREGSLATADYSLAVRGFFALYRTRYSRVSYTNIIIQRARGLLEAHPLRAYDAVHLASALEANQLLSATGQPPLTFVAADARLLAAAQAEGLNVDNPNDHP